MSDERPAHNPAALDEATDRVIREMTQAALSEDAVTRIMARVRAARDAETATPSRGWFAALLEPRVSWSAAAAAAALAAIIATAATALVLRGERSAPSVPLLAAATAGATNARSQARDQTAASTAARATNDAAAGTLANRAQADRILSAQTLNGSQAKAASGGADAGQAASDAAAVPPRVARVERPRRTGLGKAAAGIDPGVTAAMVATPDEEPRGQEAARAVPQDVRLDVTIHDQSGSAKPVAKTVSMVVADREEGSIRSETRMPFKQAFAPTKPDAPAPVESWNTESLPLFVNAWPTILPDGRVRVKLELTYRTASTPVGMAGAPLATASVTKHVIAVLMDGKPLVISESADAATDRKVSVELKATIQK